MGKTVDLRDHLDVLMGGDGAGRTGARVDYQGTAALLFAELAGS